MQCSPVHRNFILLGNSLFPDHPGRELAWQRSVFIHNRGQSIYLPLPNPLLLLQRFVKGLEGNLKPVFVAVLGMAAVGSELLGRL